MPVSAFAATAAAAVAGTNPFLTMMAGAPTKESPHVQALKLFESRFYEFGDTISLFETDKGYFLGVSWGVAADGYGTFDSATYVQTEGEEQWLVSNPTVYAEAMGEVSLTVHVFQVAWTVAWKATVLKISPWDMVAAINMTTPGGWCRQAGGYRDSLYMSAEISESATECFWGVLGSQEDVPLEEEDCFGRGYYPQIALWEKKFGEEYEDKEILQKKEYLIWDWECTDGYSLDL